MVRNHKYASLFQRSQNMTVNETVTIVNDTRNICIVNLCWMKKFNTIEE